MASQDSKICKQCKQAKSLTEFYKRKSAKDGYRNQCKACIAFLRRNNASDENGFCKKCGSNEWFKSGKCVVCNRERCKKWRANNKEYVRKKRRRYYLDNRDHLIEYYKEWRKRNPNHRKEWREDEDNYKRDLEASRRWRKKNRRYLSKKAVQWAKDNPDIKRETNRRRRARKNNAPGNYTADEFRTLCSQYNNRCLRCGRTDVKLTADHVVPLSEGGSNYISNIQPLCKSCNAKKGTKTTDYRTEESIKPRIQLELF